MWISQLFLGPPTQVNTFGTLTDTGVDAQTAVVLEFDSWFMVPAGFELIAPGVGAGQLSYVNDTGLEFRDGIAWEAAAIAQHVDDGLTDSPLHPLDFSISVMETMDSIRRSVGTLAP